MISTAEQTTPTGKFAHNKDLGPSRARVLFLIDEMDGLDGGGTERQILQLIRLSKRLGYVPHLAVLRAGEWLHGHDLGCPVFSANVGSLSRLSGWRGCWRLVRWMRRERISLVQTFFIECNIIGPWLARLAGVPVVVGSRRNLDRWHGRSNWTAALMRFIQRLANVSTDCIIANSQVAAETLIRDGGVPRSKMRIAHNGVDLDRFSKLEPQRSPTRKMLGVTDEQILVGNVSCIRPIKGILQFVEAARLVLEKDSSFRFVVVGDGEQLCIVAEHLRLHHLEDRVFLAGAHKDIRPYLAAMDVGVLSSLAEGFSNSLLEYMAAGLPAVATDVGGNREALDDSGILVPAKDPAALAEAILGLNNPALRKRLGQAARQRVARFSLEQAEQRMQQIYGELLASKIGLNR